MEDAVAAQARVSAGTPTALRKLFDLSGRTALITGGSRGLGLQIAEALGELGARLVLSARKRGELEAAVAHLERLGVDATAIAWDLRETDPGPLVDAVLERLGQVDILVNNAGTSWRAALEEQPVDGWDKVAAVNVRAVFLLTQRLGVRSMIPRRYGRVVNIASIAGLGGNRTGIGNTVAYNTSKGAVLTFTKALAAEWGKYGITVNAIAPGFFPTRLTQPVLAEVGDALAQSTPLQRLGNDEDLKGAAALLASDAGAYITGHTLVVDGGLATLVG